MKLLTNATAGVAQLTLDAGETATIDRAMLTVDAGEDSAGECIARVAGPCTITLHTTKE